MVYKLKKILQHSFDLYFKTRYKFSKGKEVDRNDKEQKYIHLDECRRSIALLRNIHLGKRCFIIGNGPSLTVRDLELLNNEYTFASNKIYLLYSDTYWRPSYYFSEDPLVIEQNAEMIKNQTLPLCFFPDYSYHQLGERENYLYFESLKEGDPHEAIENGDFPGFSYDVTKHVNWGSSIIYTQIQFAVHMGFKKIYLIGVDHNFTVPTGKERDIYISEGENNHFHKDYFKPGEKWFKPNLEVQRKSFSYAKEILSKQRIDIINATRGGCLEIFERVNLDSII